MRMLLILLIFIVVVAQMYRRKLSALIGLPSLAIAISVVAGVPLKELIVNVVSEGALRLHNPIIVIILGAALAEVVKASGIVDVLIKVTAETLGDRKILVSIILMMIVGVLFSVLGGLGAIVMVGSIVFPIFLSMGVSKLNAACIFLIGFSLGGMFNLANWSLFTDVLLLSEDSVLYYVLAFYPIALLTAIAFVVIELRRESGKSFRQSLAFSHKSAFPNRPHLGAFLTPVIPVALVLVTGIRSLLADKPEHVFQFPIISAMIVGLIYGVLTCPRRLGSRAQILSKALFEGIANVAPAIGLMIGIGILLKAVSHPDVKNILTPYVAAMIPTEASQYIMVFALAAPLALYRGPLNIWGMGSGLVAIIKDSQTLPAAAIMATLMAVGQIQGVSDPTNTYNVWIANYLGTDVVKILKRTLPYMWVMAILGLVLSTYLYF